MVYEACWMVMPRSAAIGTKAELNTDVLLFHAAANGVGTPFPVFVLGLAFPFPRVPNFWSLRKCFGGPS